MDPHRNNYLPDYNKLELSGLEVSCLDTGRRKLLVFEPRRPAYPSGWLKRAKYLSIHYVVTVDLDIADLRERERESFEPLFLGRQVSKCCSVYFNYEF